MQVGNATPAKPQTAAALGARRNLERHLAVRGRHLDGRSEHGLADGDRDLERQVLAFALEQRVLVHLDDDVDVARRRTVAAGAAVPFMVIFANLPEDLEEFTLETTSSMPGGN